MRSVLIVGAAGWSNVGDDLIASELSAFVRRNHGRPRLVGGPGVASVGPGMVMGTSLASRLRLLGEIARAGSVMIGGGGLLDDRRPNFFRAFTRVAAAARVLQTPYAFVGIGVGPVRTPEAARAYKSAVSGAQSVMVRDPDSFDRLVEIGCDPAGIQVVEDPVLWGTPTQPTATASRWAINLRQWDQEASDEGYGFDSEALVRSIAEALRSRITPEDEVSLVAMSDLPGDEDRVPLEALREAAGADWKIVSGVADATRALERAENVISMRLHGCLVGVRAGRSVLGLAYEPKVEQQASRCGFSSLRGSEAMNVQTLEAAMERLKRVPRVAENAPSWPFARA